MRKIVILCFLAITTAYGSYKDFEKSFKLQPSKLKAWTKMQKEVDCFCDKLGVSLDSHIKEIVIIINLLGTEKGHSSETITYPNDIELPITNYGDSWTYPYPSVCPGCNYDAHRLREELCFIMAIILIQETKQSSKETQLIRLYDRYWAAVYDRLLEMDLSLGSYWQKIHSSDEKASTLMEYKEKMESFTDFLINEYLYS